MLEAKSMELFTKSLATLTGGSGAVAVLLTDGSFSSAGHRKLLGGVTQAAPEHYGLCRWGISAREPNLFTQSMSTDSVSVMKYGVELGLRTWKVFLKDNLIRLI